MLQTRNPSAYSAVSSASSPQAGPSLDLAVDVVGAGIAGSWQALLLARAGAQVRLFERDDVALPRSTGHWAGGMLAPWCEMEAAEPVILRLGERALALWREVLPETPFNGSLVIAHARDRADFERFARLTTHHRRLDAAGIAALEPALDGRFRDGLFYPDEGHVEPRVVLPRLHALLQAAGVEILYRSEAAVAALLEAGDRVVIDCRGLAARDAEPALRGVKGEMVLVESADVQFARPIRLMHPRWPLYLIPRGDNRMMIGATSIESEDDRVSLRSALELLSAAYAVHPALGEARILDFGAGLRPAFPDNLPRISVEGRRISVNGLYRHGFLIAPALAEVTLNFLARGARDNEVMTCR
jgi:glycine oxidase